MENTDESIKQTPRSSKIPYIFFAPVCRQAGLPCALAPLR
jgi:hypothetical protein